MNTPHPVPVLHVSATREDRGGIQSTLRWHHAHDQPLGFEPHFISIFDRTAEWPGACASLACNGWTRIGGVQRRFASAARATPGSLAVYHDGWGVEWFAPFDGASRRIVYLHTERPHADRLLRIFGPRADGFLSVSRSYAERVRRVWTDFPEERICVLPFFVEPPAWVGPHRRAERAGRPLRIGFAGRVERGAKRLDRLPALLAELDRRGTAFQFEVLGDGTYLPELRRVIGADRRILFSGWCCGEDYWRKLAEWDVVLLLSDYEGFSRAVMECMCCGVVPVHPAFSAAAEELLGPAAPAGLYPTGDVTAAAGCIAAMAGMEPAAWRALQAACAAHLASHTAERYGRVYAEFLRRIAALPPRAGSPALSRWERRLPLGIYTRLFPQRF